VVVPVAAHKEGVLEGARAIADRLTALGLRVEFDDRDNVTPGWKFNEWELKGVPVRIEVGPRDLAENKVVCVRRDTFEKESVAIDAIETVIPEMLDQIQANLFEIARSFRDAHTADVFNMEELEKQVNGGYARAMWCGDQACEDLIKERFSATSRCMPFDQTPIAETCVCCGKPAKKLIYFAKAY
jgi:prolyl-tRNA synthetase